MLLAEIFFCSSLLSFITTWSTYMILPQPLAKGQIINILTTTSAGIDIFLSKSKPPPNPPDVAPPTPILPPVVRYPIGNVGCHVESWLTQSLKPSKGPLFLNHTPTKIPTEQSSANNRKVILNTWLFSALLAAILIILILLFAICRLRGRVAELENSHPPPPRPDSNRKLNRKATHSEVIPEQPTVDRYFRKTGCAGSSRAICQPQNPLPQAAAERESTPTTDITPLSPEAKVGKQVIDQIFERHPDTETTSISSDIPKQPVLDAALSWLGKQENSVPPASTSSPEAVVDYVPEINIGNGADGAGDDSLDSLFDEPNDVKKCAVSSQDENEKVSGDAQYISSLRTSGITGTNPARSIATREHVSPLLSLSPLASGAASGSGSSLPDTTDDESVRRARLRRLFPRGREANTKVNERSKVARERRMNRSEALDSGCSLFLKVNRAPPTDSSRSTQASPRLPLPIPPKKPFLRSSTSRLPPSQPRSLQSAPPSPISVDNTSSIRSESAPSGAPRIGEKRLSEDSEAAVAVPHSKTARLKGNDAPASLLAKPAASATSETRPAVEKEEICPPPIAPVYHKADGDEDATPTVNVPGYAQTGQWVVGCESSGSGRVLVPVVSQEVAPAPVMPHFAKVSGEEEVSALSESLKNLQTVPQEVSQVPESLHSGQPIDNDETIGPPEQPENSQDAPQERNAGANDNEWDALFQAEFAEVDKRDATQALALTPVPQQAIEDQEALTAHEEGDVSMTDAEMADSTADMDFNIAYPEPRQADPSSFMDRIPVHSVQPEGFLSSSTASNIPLPFQLPEDPPSSMELDTEQPTANLQILPAPELPDIAMAEYDVAILPPQATSNNTTYTPPVANANAPDISMGEDAPPDISIVLAPSTPIRSSPDPPAVSPQTQLRLALAVPIEDSPEPDAEAGMDFSFDLSAEAARKPAFAREPPPLKPVFATSPTSSTFQPPVQTAPAPVFGQTSWAHQAVPPNASQSRFGPLFPAPLANRTFPQTTPLAGYGFVERERNEPLYPQVLPIPAATAATYGTSSFGPVVTSQKAVDDDHFSGSVPSGPVRPAVNRAGQPTTGGLRPPGYEQYKATDGVADYGDTDDEQRNDEQGTDKRSGHDCSDEVNHERDDLDGSDEDDGNAPPPPASGAIAHSSSSSRTALTIPPPYNSNTPGPGHQSASPSTPPASRRHQTRADGRVIATPRQRIFAPLPAEHPLAITPISASTPSAPSSILSSDVVPKPSPPYRQDEDHSTDDSYTRVVVDVLRSGYEVQDHDQDQRLDRPENAHGSPMDRASAITDGVRRMQQSRPQTQQAQPHAQPAEAQAHPDPLEAYLGMAPADLSALAAARGAAYNSFAQTAPESTLSHSEAHGGGTGWESYPAAPGDSSDNPQVVVTPFVADGPSVGELLHMLATQSRPQHGTPEIASNASALPSSDDLPDMPSLDEFLLPLNDNVDYAPFNMANTSLDLFNPYDPYEEDQLKRDMHEWQRRGSMTGDPAAPLDSSVGMGVEGDGSMDLG